MTGLVRRKVTASLDVEDLTECLLVSGSLSHSELIQDRCGLSSTFDNKTLRFSRRIVTELSNCSQREQAQ